MVGKIMKQDIYIKRTISVIIATIIIIQNVLFGITVYANDTTNDYIYKYMYRKNKAQSSRIELCQQSVRCTYAPLYFICDFLKFYIDFNACYHYNIYKFYSIIGAKKCIITIIMKTKGPKSIAFAYCTDLQNCFSKLKFAEKKTYPTLILFCQQTTPR